MASATIPEGLEDTKLGKLLQDMAAEALVLERYKQVHEAEKDKLRNDLDMLRRAYASLNMENLELKDKLKARDWQSEVLGSFERRVMCVIDGDGAIFSRTLIEQGRAGGLTAVRRLREGILTQLKDDTSLPVWIYVFTYKRGIAKALDVNELQMDLFIAGFNQADGRSFLVDIGQGKEAADARVRELLQEVRSPHVARIFFGGCHDNGYVPVLDSHITQGYKDKLVLVPGYDEIAAGIKRLELPTLEIPGLFERKKIVIPVGNRRPSDDIVVLKKTSTPNGSATPSAAMQALLTQDLVDLSSDSSPPSPARPPAKYLQSTTDLRGACNMYYLTGHCNFGEQCKYSHDLELSEADIAIISAKCKRVPCEKFKYGECLFGRECMYSHMCRFPKSKCKFLKKGMCIAGGSEAHLDG